MKEYAYSLVFLLSLCSVSSFRIYYPGESKHDDRDDTVTFIASSMTALCTNLCMTRLNKNLRDCQTWCQSTSPLSGASTSLELHHQQQLNLQQLQQERPLQELESSGGFVATKRQVDPLLSCIEARCAGLVHSRYGSCIYSKCIASWKKRSFSSSSFSSPSSHSSPSSERFPSSPSLPVSSSDNEEKIKSPPPPWRGDGGGGQEGAIKGGDDDDGRSAGGRLGDVGEEGGGRGSSLEGRNLLTEQWIDLHLQALPATATKRSWNDVMQTCIEYNCGAKSPGSFDYNVCIQQSCSKHMFGRRRR